jgi:hypothetical protein
VTQRFGLSDIGHEVLTAANVKTNVFWDAAPYSLAEMADVSEVLTASVTRAIRKITSIVLVMGAVSTCETSVNFCEAIRRSIPEDSHLRMLGCPDTEHTATHTDEIKTKLDS